MYESEEEEDSNMKSPYSNMGRSDIVYEKNRRKKLEEKSIKTLNMLTSIILALSAILTIGVFQFEEFIKTINGKNSGSKLKSYCSRIKIANIDVISSIISLFLTITFIVFSKRLSFLRNRFKYRNFGLPVISSNWNKNDRFNSSFIYGIIAYQVFTLVQNNLSGTIEYDELLQIKDVTGLASLVVQIIEVFLIGLRYYPVLVSTKCNAFVIVFLASLYMWFDLIDLIFQIGKCGSVTIEISDKEMYILKDLFWYFFSSKILKAIPICIFSAFIVINLTYKWIIILTDYTLRSNSSILKALRAKAPSDSLFCDICDIADDENMTYSQSDLIYVMDLLNKPKKINEDKILNNLDEQIDFLNDKYDYVLVTKRENESYLRAFFKEKVYDWQNKFCFTSRYCQIQVVAILGLFYFFIYLGYYICYYWIKIEAYDLTSLKEDLTINMSEYVCNVNKRLCSQAVKYIPLFNIKLTNDFIKILPGIRRSMNSILMFPLFATLFICLIQQFLSIRECKQHLIELYKGKCVYIKKLKSMNNSSISESSFHFGGFCVGYFLWGFFIIYMALLFVSISVTALRHMASFETLKSVFFIILPFVSGYLVLNTTTSIFAKYVFLQRESKILALNNFRSFNVFTYFYFYHDCLMGYLSAILRIVSTVISSILMMPRISYSFLGRHLENFDNGYSTYSGFLHMEASHTNPVLICFCGMLYYKGLSEHLTRYKKEKRHILETEEIDYRMLFQLKKFTGFLPKVKDEKVYNRRILNKWHLLIRLTMNQELIAFRKQFLVVKEKTSFFGAATIKQLVIGKYKNIANALPMRSNQNEIYEHHF